uniref:Endonuclease III n=1 Tax=Oscillatoriales cyanobacterium SpSt-402 TaxID=2282168 RepID=A0A832M2N1_9CYAN
MELFDIDQAIARLREAVKSFPQAAMFALSEAGFDTLFEQLIACILSIRTYDEVSLPTAQRLFARARTPSELCQLSITEIEALIRESTYADRKAEQIHAIAHQIVTQHSGNLPQDVDVLLSFKGVGLKCAHLALGIACKLPYISVDTHVHRVTNRWGYVRTKTPEKTTIALEAKLPKDYWIEINRLLVPFGKHVCTNHFPSCSTCSLLQMCQQVGVQKHR